jgi:DNA-damage-inducible protein J
MAKTKTKTVTVRLDPDLKDHAERIFGELGLTVSQAIALFYRQVELHDGLPFEVRIPNATTRRALEDAKARRGLTSYASTDELFADLGI